MFGPESGKNGWRDLTLVYDRVRIRNRELCSSFLHIFETEVFIFLLILIWFVILTTDWLECCYQGCNMVEMTCEEHDKLAAKSQFLTHTIGRYLFFFLYSLLKYRKLPWGVISKGWFCRVLAEMEVESTPVNTKGFESLIQLVWRWNYEFTQIKIYFVQLNGLFLFLPAEREHCEG